MELTQFIMVASITGAACIVQASTGFGLGLVATPAMVWVGVPLPEAIAIASVITLVQMGTNGFQLRRHVQWKGAWTVIILRVTTLPLGTLLLLGLVGLGEIRIKQAIGLLILLAVVARWALRVEPREHVPSAWHWAAGISSGVMMGLAGMGGPPIVLWAQAHRWTSLQQRATLFAVLLSGTVLNLIMLWFAFGRPVIWASLTALACAPFALAGAAVGMRVGGRMSPEQLRFAASVLLTLLAVGSIVGPLLD